MNKKYEFYVEVSKWNLYNFQIDFNCHSQRNPPYSKFVLVLSDLFITYYYCLAGRSLGN